MACSYSMTDRQRSEVKRCRRWNPHTRSGAGQLFPGFDERLAPDAVAGHRSGLQPFDGNVLAARFADPVHALLDILQRLADLADQHALAVADPQREIAFGVEHS